MSSQDVPVTREHSIGRQPLRIAAVFEDPTNLPEWGLRLLEHIVADQHLELCAVIEPGARFRKEDTAFLTRLWLSIEQRIFARSKTVKPIPPSMADQNLPRLRDGETDGIAALKLDVILDFSDQYGLTCDTELARHGSWFMDFPVNDPGIAGMAQLTSQGSVSHITLMRRGTNEKEPVGITKGLLNLKYIASRNGLFMLEMAVPLLLRELRWTQRNGRPKHDRSLAFQRKSPPNSLQLLWYLMTLCANLAMKAAQEIAARTGLRPNMFYLISANSNLHDFDPKTANRILSDDNSFYADPFLWVWDGECYCFFEEYDYRAKLGHISVGRFEDGQLTEIRPVLKRDYHLSFPFLFEDKNTLYMMPETFHANRLEVWRCVAFPDQWELYTTAFEGTWAADSTLTKLEDSWWLFTNIATDAFLDTSTALHIFEVDGPDLTNPRPHACNPVIFDSRYARNGGRIVELDGELFRMSQDNSHGRYGYGLNIMKVSHLSLAEYKEERVCGFAPDFTDGIDGCHHLDIRSGRVIMDVRKRFGGFAKLSRRWW